MECQDLSANVLKVGHHGSTSSSIKKFLQAVKPEFAVISVGEGNDYGHPASSTLERLNSLDITTYQTDKNGTVTATSNGSDIQFTTSK